MERPIIGQNGQYGHVRVAHDGNCVEPYAALVLAHEENERVTLAVFPPQAGTIHLFHVKISPILLRGNCFTPLPLPVAEHSERIMESAALPAVEAGARNSAADQSRLQQIYQLLMELGLELPEEEVEEAANPAPPAEQQIPLREGVEYERMLEATYEGTGKTIALTIIRPGFNTSKGRYYTSQGVKAIAEAMRGQKMYLDHPTPTQQRERPERSVHDWVATLTETWIDADGAAKGKAVIHNADFNAQVATLAEAGLLDRLGASINAIGTGEKAVVEGYDTFMVTGVQKTDPFRSVDWVTEPGAGGRAELLESAAPGGAEEQTEMAGQGNEASNPSISAADIQSIVATAVQNAVKEAMVQVTTRFTKETETLAEGLAAVQKFVADQKANEDLDLYMVDVYATEAAKTAARRRLLASGAEITRESVKAAVQAVVREAAEIAGGGTGVRGLGATPEQAGGDQVTAMRESLTANTTVAGEDLDWALQQRFNQ